MPFNTQSTGDTPIGRQAQFRLRPPKPSLKYLEARAILEAASLLPRAPSLRSLPKGDGRPVVLLPGFFADDRSTWALQKFLRYLDYDASGWGLGRNDGDPEYEAERFIKRLDATADPSAPVTLIGWSLGGVIARITAMQRPELVQEIITMGTPVEGGPKYTSAGSFYARRRGMDLDEFEQHVHEMNEAGVRSPLTVIYSRSDAVVGWRAALDRYNPQAKHVEVSGSHLGLGFNPRVWRIVAETLNASAGAPTPQ